MSAGLNVLLGSLAGGAVGLGILSVCMPSGLPFAEQLTIGLNVFLVSSVLGLSLARCSHLARPGGCVTGPLVMFLWFVLGVLGMEGLFSEFPGALLGSMILLSTLGASWVSLLTVSLLDVLGLGVYALALNATAVWVATRSPLAPPGWALAAALAVFSLGVMLATVLAHALGRAQESRRAFRQAPAEPGPRRAAHSPDAPDEPPSQPLPPGAEPPPARIFVRTDGTRAFCCGDGLWPAWLFEEGRWLAVTPPARPPSMEWPRAVGETYDGRLFLKTQADVDCWYWLGEGKAHEVEPTPPIRLWWGSAVTQR